MYVCDTATGKEPWRNGARYRDGLMVVDSAEVSDASGGLVYYGPGVSTGPANAKVVVEEAPALRMIVVSVRASAIDHGDGWTGKWAHSPFLDTSADVALSTAERYAKKLGCGVRLIRHPERPR